MKTSKPEENKSIDIKSFEGGRGEFFLKKLPRFSDIRCSCGKSISIVNEDDVGVKSFLFGLRKCSHCFKSVLFVKNDGDIVSFPEDIKGVSSSEYAFVLNSIRFSLKNDIFFEEGLLSRAGELFRGNVSITAGIYSILGSGYLVKPLSSSSLSRAEKFFNEALDIDPGLEGVKAGLAFIEREKRRHRYVTCNICGKDNFRKLCDNAFAQTIVMCNECGLIYRSVQPLIDSYRENYGYEYIEYRNKITDWEGWHKSRTVNMDKVGLGEYEKELKAVGSVLEIGCAEGQMLSLFKKRGWREKGLDISYVMTRYAREKLGLDAVCGTLKETKFPDNSFDLVAMFHVIEHFPDPVMNIKESWRILKEGGRIIIETPCYDLPNITNEWFDDEDHFTFFSESTLKRMLRESGFRNISLYAWELKVDRPSSPGGINMFYLIVCAQKTLNLNYMNSTCNR